ncbi:hypothetical protein CC2G_010959 [Coprinopsis cinerea AmutBmut pab1-1]|nr:hypothetical protein CC2G_010959 [Coprinopsis cinerea AmutBmut pab1-1]
MANWIDPFTYNTLSHPTTVQTTIHAQAVFSKFDTTGRFIATATARPQEGLAVVWDLQTRNSIRFLDGHVKPVTSIDWSRNSRYVLTSSKDWNVIVWDLASSCDPPQRHRTLRFDAPVVSASFHPKNSRIILVLLTTGEAFLCDTRKETRSRTPLKEVTVDDSDDDEDEPSSRARSYMTVARFNPSGKHIFIGTSTGTLLVFRTRTKTMIARHKIAGANVIKGLEFRKNGRELVTNSSDRTLRQFIVPTYPSDDSEPTNPSTSTPSSSTSPSSTPTPTPTKIIEQDLEPTHRFHDPINKTAWHAMACSGDGDWLAGGAADPAAHKIYVWDLSNDGQYTATLDGGREPLTHLHWHPKKSIIASTTNIGNVLIWHSPHPERWGAFAGGFEEVDENVEYEEREDEFDIEDEETILERKMKAEEDKVDIETMIISPPTSGDTAGSMIAAAAATGDANGNGTIAQRIMGGGSNNGNGNGSRENGGKVAASNEGGTSKAPNGDPTTSTTSGASSSNEKMDFRPTSVPPQQQAEVDPDTLWAMEDPDDDIPSLWRMKIIMEDDEGDE